MNKKSLFIALLFLATGGSLSAQGLSYTAGPFLQSGSLYVCPVPSGGTPCPSPSTIYSNVTLTTQINNPIQVFAGNAVTFFIAAGQYTIQFPASGYSTVITLGSSSGGGTVAPNNKDIYVSPNCGSQTNCFPIKGDVKVSYTGTTTNGSPTVSCSVSDATCSFTSAADVAKQILITNANASGGSAQVSGDVAFTNKTLKTTISAVNSATNITMSQNANQNIVGIANVAWGTPDGANLTAAFNALVAAARGTCGTLELPNTIMFTNVAQFINGPSSCFKSVGLNRQGLLVKGVGISSTWIIPTNDFNFATCTGPDTTGNSCFFDNGSGSYAGGTIVQDLSIVGLGQSLTGTTHAVSVAGMESNSFMFNVNCLGWGGAATSMVGLTVGQKQNVYAAGYNIQFDGCGSTGLSLLGAGPFYLSNGSYFGDNILSNVTVGGSSGAVLASSGNGFGPIFPTGGAAIVSVGTNTKFFSSNDTFGYLGCNNVAATAAVYASGGVTQLTNDLITTGCTSAVWADFSSIIHARGTSFTGITNSVKTTSGASFFDDCGNTFSPLTVANAGTIFGSCSVGGLVVAGNFADTTNLGTSTFTVGAGSTTYHGTVTITYAGTLATPTTFTYTFPTTPQAPLIAPASCIWTLANGGGTNTTPTSIIPSTPSATAIAVVSSFAAAPTAANTTIYQWSCGN